jgi:hypothetical protein
MTFEEEYILETYKSLISFGTESIKALLLLNGGALIAILAYLGDSHTKPDFCKLEISIGSFVAGISFCAISFFFAYRVQYVLLNELMARHKAGRHVTWLTIAFITLFLSLACFICGAYFGTNAFISI